MSRRSLALVLVALLLTACGGSGDGATGTGPRAPGDAVGPDGETTPAGELTVLAAASLRVVLEDVADLFTAQHPGVEIAFSFAGSTDLVAQLDAGAPADVLATADESTMATALDAGTIEGRPVVFAANTLALVVPAGNPAGVTGLDDSLDGAALVVCAPQVPCGAATASLAQHLAVTLQPVSEEGSVTDVLGKVTSGQADAGLVYATDAVAAGAAVEVLPVEGAQEVVNRYPIAVTSGTPRPELAAAWVEFVLGAEAQEVLQDAGFGAP